MYTYFKGYREDCQYIYIPRKTHRYAGNPCDLYINEYICGVLLFQTIGIVKKR